jgi:ascorbate-specific PTS system EIIC-type component UlaA
MLTGHCVPFQLHAKEVITVVFFVAITEIIFLNVITKKYWSVNPSQVRRQLGESMKRWIKQNHPQSTN